MMKRSLFSTFSFVLALGATAAGCAAQAPGEDDDPGEGSGSGSGSAEQPPLTAEGKYALVSDFDIATNMPGTAGEVVNMFIAATDDADDPAHWILDQLVAKLPDGTFKNIVKGAIPFVSGYLNDRLLQVAPDFVVTIRDMGNKFGQAARHFGTLETLDVPANGMATHTMNGVQFTVDQIELQYMFKDYQMQDVAVPNVGVQVDKLGKLTVADHKLPLSYGKVMRIAMDEVIIPLVDPSATNLEDILTGLVNCHAVGQYVYEAVGIGAPSTFEAACTAGLHGGSQVIYAQIGKIDSSALEFNVNGVAKGIDKNHDGKMDSIQVGAWAGTLSYGGNGAPLAHGQFTGQRL
ncbi:MAG TPA: hypothetical protein VMZ53_11510 [Kofleriaceae bacterium]|nr:hypothetical protein [Kofleriaceae bacterium]